MKNILISLMLSVLIFMTTAGCAVVRVMQTQAGVAVEKAASIPEVRKTKLNKRDFRLEFGATDDSLGIRLEYRPYYDLERREIVTYKPQKAASTLEILIGLASAGLLGWAVFDNLVETGEIAVNDEGELYNVTEFDWDGASSLQKAIMVGVPLDSILWIYYATKYETTLHEPWMKSGDVPGEWQLLGNHPYRIELQTYNFGKDYSAKSGIESIPIREFLVGIKNPAHLTEIDSVSLQALTEFDGKAYQKTVRLTAQSQLQPFHDTALAALGVDMISTGKPRLMPRPEAVARWVEASVRAGGTATLRVTAKNTGKGTLYRFAALTVSSNLAFNNRELKFGKIEPGESRTFPVSFELDKLMRTQEVPILIQFGEYNGHVPANIEDKLKVIETPRPRFDYAYRIVDGGTATSTGNGDGIIQPGESADIQVTIRNSGKGNATDVTAMLNLLDANDVDMYGDTFANLHNLVPGDSKVATFNIGVKRRASISGLRLKLSVEENIFGSETKLTETLDLPIGRVAAPKISDRNLLATITSNAAPVYDGASSGTAISAKLPRDSQVKVSGQLDEWYRVELDVRDQKVTGWVHEAQLTTAKVPRRSGSKIEKPTAVEVFHNTPPTLELFEPEQRDIEVEDSTLLIQALAVANNGIERVELTVNGKTGNIIGRGMNTIHRTPPTVFRIEENVRLNYGENTIKLNAFDTDNQASEAVVLSVTRQREEVRNDYALLFGVNSYEHFDPWHKLNNPIPDADAIGNELQNRYGFAVEVVSDPSRDEILTKINQYARRRYNDNDQFLIFFAGHGYYEERNNIGIGYLVASDTLPPDADLGKSSYISHGDFRERIENIGCEHIFLMVDACFSGAFDAPVDQFNRARGTNRIPDDITKRQFIKQSLAYKTRWYLTSGGKEYVSDGRPNQHSPFTRRVLDALRSAGGGAHGILTLEDIGRYVEKATPQPRAGEFGSNAPGSNFLFIRE